MLKIAVCDDNPQFTEAVSTLLDKWSYDKANIAVSCFSNGHSLAEAHSVSPFDIIFLDVVMPIINGIETAALIRREDKSVKIIFLTSSAEFALDSYSVKANGYLLKPIEEERFYALINDIFEEVQKMPKHIFARSTSSVHKIPINTISYIEAQGKHVSISLANGTEIRSDEPFYYFKNSLLAEDGFFSCHRSYIVNINHISTYTSKEIVLNTGVRIPISRNCHKEFENAYFETAFGKVDDIL